MKIQLIIIFLISLFIKFSKNQFSSFIMELDSFQERCLSEYYKSDTVVIIELKSPSPEILLEVRGPDGKILYHHLNTTSIFSLPVKINGFYSICSKNMGKYSGEITLTIKSGVGANDLSSLAKSKDLEPIDYELDRIIRSQSLLEHFKKVFQTKQVQFSSLYSSISTKIIFYSILIIAGMIFIGIIETLYLKRFMEKRKII